MYYCFGSCLGYYLGGSGFLFFTGYYCLGGWGCGTSLAVSSFFGYSFGCFIIIILFWVGLEGT
jgi:hypothetical protein